MILRSKEGQSPFCQLWDPEENKVLLKFHNGEFETDDKEIIRKFDKYYAPKGQIEATYEVEETPKDEKAELIKEIESRFGVDVDARQGVPKLKSLLAKLEAEA